MNNILKVSLIVIAVLAVAGGLLFAGGLAGAFWSQREANGFVSGNSGQVPQGGRQDGRGNPVMPGRPGNGTGPGMRSMPGNRGRANATPLTVDEAKQAARAYIQTLDIDGLQTGAALVFDNGAYVAVVETATGNGAFELRVNPFSKTAYPEMGPASMWNLKYGGVIQAGRMNGRRNNPNAAPAATPANVPADMPIAQAQAIKDAQAFLDKAYPGATASTTAVRFYGYYTLAFSKDGKVAGVISVNGYNGQVLLHHWRGTFIEESK